MQSVWVCLLTWFCLFLTPTYCETPGLQRRTIDKALNFGMCVSFLFLIITIYDECFNLFPVSCFSHSSNEIFQVFNHHSSKLAFLLNLMNCNKNTESIESIYIFTRQVLHFQNANS